jgi:hypothetical protein
LVNGSTATEGLSGSAREGWRVATSGTQTWTDAKDAYWPGDIFELLLPDILKDYVELSCGILLNPCRHANSARVRQAFEPDCDVYAVTKEFTALDYDVAHIDAQPELDTPVGGRRRVPLSHARLKFGGATQSIHDTAELDQEAVARRFDEPTVMRGNCRLE